MALELNQETLDELTAIYEGEISGLLDELLSEPSSHKELSLALIASMQATGQAVATLVAHRWPGDPAMYFSFTTAAKRMLDRSFEATFEAEKVRQGIQP